MFRCRFLQTQNVEMALGFSLYDSFMTVSRLIGLGILTVDEYRPHVVMVVMSSKAITAFTEAHEASMAHLGRKGRQGLFPLDVPH
jgi:hypothetical protein